MIWSGQSKVKSIISDGSRQWWDSGRNAQIGWWDRQTGWLAIWKTDGVGRQPGTQIDGQSRDVRGEACGSAESVSALQAFLPAWRLSAAALCPEVLMFSCEMEQPVCVLERVLCAVHASYSLVFVRTMIAANICVWGRESWWSLCVCIAIVYVTLQFVSACVCVCGNSAAFHCLRVRTRVNDGVRGRDREEDGHKSYLVGNIAPLWQLSVTAPPPVGKWTEKLIP